MKVAIWQVERGHMAIYGNAQCQVSQVKCVWPREKRNQTEHRNNSGIQSLIQSHLTFIISNETEQLAKFTVPFYSYSYQID